MATRAGVLGPTLDLEGTVSEYTATVQGGEQVVQFVLARDGADPLAVEMRGTELHGVLRAGHRVALVAPADVDKLDDRTLRPLKLKNLTTGGVVSVTRPNLRRRALRAGTFSFREVWKDLLTIFVTAAVAAVLGKSLSGSSRVQPTAAPNWAALAVIEAGWFALWFVSAYFDYRNWRWHGGALPLLRFVTVGLSGGIVIAGGWWIFLE